MAVNLKKIVNFLAKSREIIADDGSSSFWISKMTNNFRKKNGAGAPQEIFSSKKFLGDPVAGFPIFLRFHLVTEPEIDLEDLQQAVIHLKDAVDVMKPLEKSPVKVEMHDFTTVFWFLESAKSALFRASIPNAAKSMDRVIQNIKAACKTKSEKHQKKLITAVLDALNQVLDLVEKSIASVMTPIVTHMSYEELLSKLANYS